MVKTSSLEVFTEAGYDLIDVADLKLSACVSESSDELLAYLLNFVLLGTC